jgi:thiol-disulfide isomerase/thioredoxin
MHPTKLLRSLTALSVAVVALCALVACTGGKDAVDTSSNGQFRYVAATSSGSIIDADKRKPVGAVKGGLLGGGDFALADQIGSVVVLNFWGTWCAPCVGETPQFDQIYRETKAQGVLFVGVDVKDSESAATAFVRDKAISYPILFDPNAKTALQLGNVPMRGLPASVVIDRKGRVAGVYLGRQLPADITPVITKLVAES